MTTAPQPEGTTTATADAPAVPPPPAKPPRPNTPYGLFYARWLVLANLSLNLLAAGALIVAAVLRASPRTPCVTGGLCGAAVGNWWQQFAIVWALFAVLTIVFRCCAGPLEYQAASERRSPVVRLVREASDFGVLDGLIAGLAVTSAVGAGAVLLSLRGSGFAVGLASLQVLTACSVWLTLRLARLTVAQGHRSPAPPAIDPAQLTDESGAFIPSEVIAEYLMDDLAFLSASSAQEIAAHLLLQADDKGQSRAAAEAAARAALRHDLALLVRSGCLTGVHLALYEAEFDPQRTAYRLLFHAAYHITFRDDRSAPTLQRQGGKLENLPVASPEHARLALIIDFRNDYARQRVQEAKDEVLRDLQLEWRAHDGPFDAAVVAPQGAAGLTLAGADVSRRELVH